MILKYMMIIIYEPNNIFQFIKWFILCEFFYRAATIFKGYKKADFWFKKCLHLQQELSFFKHFFGAVKGLL